MLAYILRRIIYGIPVLIGVNLLTFALFFMVNTPDDMARMHLGQKYVKQELIDRWLEGHGYNQPLFYNDKKSGSQRWTQTLFFQKSIKLFLFDFGSSDAGRDISQDIFSRMWPSLALAIPILICGLILDITMAMLMIFFRGTYIDVWGVVLCIVMMSISSLFYIIGGQFIIAKMLNLVPISGYSSGFNSFKYIILPVLVAIVGGIGGSVRWYRTIFLEEMGRDYVRTARAKGLSRAAVLYKHIFRNALIPILTGIVVIIPTLFMGSLILESFFGIPGLGSYTIDAIGQQDFAIVRAMVVLGSLLYIVGLIMTDISYTLVDPRIRLE